MTLLNHLIPKSGHSIIFLHASLITQNAFHNYCRELSFVTFLQPFLWSNLRILIGIEISSFPFKTFNYLDWEIYIQQ